MNSEALARSAIGGVWIRLIERAMESRLRHRFLSSERILADSSLRPGQTVLEVGCGTGFFTIPAARLIGAQGRLVAMDILAESVDLVAGKARAAGLQNVQVIKGDALNTRLESGTFDVVILYGLIPAPMLPLSPLLAEMHRVLRPEGILTVWPSFRGLLPRSILKSGLFSVPDRRRGVYNFTRLTGLSPSTGSRQAIDVPDNEPSGPEYQGGI